MEAGRRFPDICQGNGWRQVSVGCPLEGGNAVRPVNIKADNLPAGVNARIGTPGAGDGDRLLDDDFQRPLQLRLNGGLSGRLALKAKVITAIVLDCGTITPLCHAIAAAYASPSDSTSMIIAMLAASPGRRPILITRV